MHMSNVRAALDYIPNGVSFEEKSKINKLETKWKVLLRANAAFFNEICVDLKNKKQPYISGQPTFTNPP